MFLSQKDVVLSNAFSVFSAFIKMNMRYLYFIPLIEYITLTDFQIFKQTLRSWDEFCVQSFLHVAALS